jgi:asparagine synthase (glutamine-hydrolysing)
MCGLTGFVKLEDDKKNPQDQIWSMVSVIRHRGPDAQNVSFPSDNVGLGHARLAVIDLESTSNQPFSDIERRFHLVFNGEIYNYKYLRQVLKGKGYIFRTNSDTEVLLTSYIEWGISCIERLEGMFAFALYDVEAKMLHLVRDRLGKKPLFYLCDKSKLIFGSEIKSILAYGDIDKTVDEVSLNTYLGLGYCASPDTLFLNVKQLEPGHRLQLGAEGKVCIRRYWEVNIAKSDDRGELYYKRQLSELLDQSIEKRLIADVPVGCFLSGGIDSSAITVRAARKYHASLKTFSVGFGKSSYNELPYAKEVSDLCGTDHYSILVNNVTHELIESIVWHAEEPTADSSMVPTYQLCKLAKEQVTVALSGDGADEIFAGYETYTAFYLSRLYKLLPKLFRAGISASVLNSTRVTEEKYAFREKVRRFTSATEFDDHKMHLYWRSIVNDETKSELLSGSLFSALTELPIYKRSEEIFTRSNATSLNKMLLIDTKLYLPNDMLVKVDRMSMAHSLEVRSPFLDHKLTEFAFSLPDKYKLKFFKRKKYLLRKVLSDELPSSILDRKKAGFNSPINEWIKGQLREPIYDCLFSKSFLDKTGFNRSVINKLLERNEKGLADHSFEIWNIYVLAIWFDLFQSN